MEEGFLTGDAGFDYLVKGLPFGNYSLLESSDPALLKKILLNLASRVSSGNDKVYYVDWNGHVNRMDLTAHQLTNEERFHLHIPPAEVPDLTYLESLAQQAQRGGDSTLILLDGLYDHLLTQLHPPHGLAAIARELGKLCSFLPRWAEEAAWVLGVRHIPTGVLYQCHTALACEENQDGTITFELTKNRKQTPDCVTIHTDILGRLPR